MIKWIKKKLWGWIEERLLMDLYNKESSINKVIMGEVCRSPAVHTAINHRINIAVANWAQRANREPIPEEKLPTQPKKGRKE